MIKFKKIEWSNFLSTGSQPIEVILDEHNKTLIRGENGAGKTTSLDALVYCLFNKPLRAVSLGQLVNSINKKKLMTKVQFEVNGVEYEVHRGQKPAVFQIFVNGEAMDEDSASKLLQAKLEEILGCNYKSFMQVIVMASTNNKVFMELTAQERRNFVESMLDIEVVGVMASKMKDRVKEVKTKKLNISTKLEILKNNIQAKEEIVNSLNTVSQSQLDDLYAEKASLEQEQAKLQKEYDDINNTKLSYPEPPTKPEFVMPLMTGLPDEPIYAPEPELPEFVDLPDIVLPEAPCELVDVMSLNTERVNIENTAQKLIDKANDVKGVASFYVDNESCDRCNQPIDAEFRDNIISESNAEINGLGIEYTHQSKLLEEIKSKIEDAVHNNDIYNAWSANRATVMQNHNQAKLTHRSKYDADCLALQNKVSSENEKLRNEYQIEYNKIESENTLALNTAKSAYDLEIADIDHKYNVAVNLIDSEYSSKLNEAITSLNNCKTNLNKTNLSITKLENDKNNDAENHIKELGELNKEHSDLLIYLAEISEEEELCALGTEMLKDSGLKAKIIKQYLPKINHSINDFLERLGGDYSFVLDEGFNETIKHRYRDNYSYQSFSNGEKSRINFAILLMWRDLAQSKNTVSSNLLFIDEVLDGALDDEGIYNVMDLFETMTDTNITVISHRKEISDHFDQIIDVKKIGNFSNYNFSEI